VIVKSSDGGAPPERPGDGVYSVELRPGGETAAIAEAPRGDARVYTSIETAPDPVEGAIAEIPGLKISPSPIEFAAAQGAPGNASRRGGHDRLPATSAEGEGRGSGATGTGRPVGVGRGTGSGGGDGSASAIPAVLLASPAPRYPDSARRRNVQGAALVEISIRADGAVERGRIVESSGNPELDAAAVEAVGKWRYRPATLLGKSIPSVQRVRFVFRLE
jgi:protein TonB